MVMGNKERILETAKRLFGELGYAETTYKRIAQEAGIADGLIAHHYGSKENLFQLVEIDILSTLLLKIDESQYYASDGLSGVLNFAKCILKASTTPESGFLTLLRCSLCALHSEEQVGEILGMFEAAGKRVGVI